MAGRASADDALMLPLWRKCKEMVKGRSSVNTARRQFQLMGDETQKTNIETSEHLLRDVKHFDECVLCKMKSLHYILKPAEA